jgi:hypothetical protein
LDLYAAQFRPSAHGVQIAGRFRLRRRPDRLGRVHRCDRLRSRGAVSDRGFDDAHEAYGSARSAGGEPSRGVMICLNTAFLLSSSRPLRLVDRTEFSMI